MPSNVVSLIQPLRDTGLIKYDAACRAIAEAKSTDEAKEIRNKAVALAAYARQAKNKDLEADAIEIRLRATQKLGHLIQAQKNTLGLNRGNAGGFSSNPPDDRPTLASQGIDKNLANAARKLAGMSETKFTTRINEVRAKINHHHHGLRRSGEYEFYTPPEAIAPVHQMFRTIDLDPASCKMANRVVKAERILTETDNALLQAWYAARLFANFPYARSMHAQFVAKLIREYQAGHIKEAIILTADCCSAAWFHAALAASSSVCLAKKRIVFLESNGQPMKAALGYGSCYFYFGENVDLFESVFCQIGSCVRLSRGYNENLD